MKIALAADHGGFDLKELIKKHLSQEHEVIDLGTNSTESVDYPEYGKKVAETVAMGGADRGIAICGTGIGISMAANKVKGIRAALCTNTFMAEMTRKHKGANVLALGGRVLSNEEALPIVDTFIDTEFEGGRHQRRVDQLSELEN